MKLIVNELSENSYRLKEDQINNLLKRNEIRQFFPKPEINWLMENCY